MSGPARDSPGDPATFEEALRLLDDVVARLERGDVGLEEAVALFERGQGYLAVCRDRLAAAQKRIEELTGDEPPPAASAGTASTDEPF